MSTITTLQERVAQIAKKSGKTEAEVNTAYEQALTTVPANVKKSTRREKLALMIVNRDLAVNTLSTAEVYEGVIIGARKVKDVLERPRAKAISAYEENPQQALDDGLVKVEGDKVIVLDNRPELNGSPNKKFGQPRAANMFLRDIIIAARKPGEDTYTIGRMQLWNQQAKIACPVLKTVTFKANGGIDAKTGEYDLRSSVDTMFEIKSETTDEEIINLLDEWPEAYLKELGEILPWHKQIQTTPQFWDSYIITEGTVSWPPQEFENSIKLVITDDSLAGDELQSDGITVWVPKELQSLVNFGKGSMITVVARTSDQEHYDREAKAKDGKMVVQLNALSVIGRPGLTTSLGVEAEAL